VWSDEAMLELDPYERVPDYARAAQQLGGSWLTLAHRLGDKTCRHCASCTQTCALQFDLKTLQRVCKCNKLSDASERSTLSNALLFETQPWRDVDNAVDLLAALREVQAGSCIRISGHIQLQQFPVGIPLHRLLGPPCVGQEAQASVA
jgi:hypothetical protein